MKQRLMAAIVTVLLVSNGVASAQQLDKSKARTLFEKGKKAFEEKQYTDAIKLFKQAYSHWPSYYVIQFNIALSYYHIQDKINAVTHLRLYLKKATQTEIQSLPKPLVALQQDVGVLIIQAPDANATIWVDGKMAGKGRVEKVVLPGRRKAAIKMGSKTVEKTMVVSPGTEKVWELSAMPQGPVQPVGPKPVIVKPLGRLHWAYFAAAAGLTLAIALAATGTGVKTLKLKDEYDKNPNDTDLQKDGKTMRNVTNALWGVAGGLAVGTAVLAIFTRWSGQKKERSSSLRITPQILPQGGLLTLTWDH